MSGLCPSTTLATSPRRSDVSSTATSASASGEAMGWTCWIPSL